MKIFMHIVPQNTGDTACSSFIASYGVWHQWNLVCSGCGGGCDPCHNYHLPCMELKEIRILNKIKPEYVIVNYHALRHFSYRPIHYVT